MFQNTKVITLCKLTDVIKLLLNLIALDSFSQSHFFDSGSHKGAFQKLIITATDAGHCDLLLGIIHLVRMQNFLKN